MDDVLFVINPSAASGRAGRVWDRLTARSRALRRAAVIRTADPFAATRQLIERLKPSVRRVVAVGGDGTLHHTANVMLSLPAPEGRTLGLIPAGTGSDLARGLKLARAPDRALSLALEGEAVDLDVLRISHGAAERYVVNLASVGVSAPVVAAVNDREARGRAAYLGAALRALTDYAPLNARITVDGACWHEGPLLLLALANGVRFGRGMRIAPGARADDALMEVVLVEAVGLARLLPWLPSLYMGLHYAAPFVRHCKAREVAIEPAQDARASDRFEADGELSLPLPGRVSVVPGALRLRGPAPGPSPRRPEPAP